MVLMDKQEFIFRCSISILTGMASNPQWNVLEYTAKVKMVISAVELSEILHEQLNINKHKQT